MKSENTNKPIISPDWGAPSNGSVDLLANQTYIEDLKAIAQMASQESTSAITIGQLAEKWICNSRYSRFLNPSRFAEDLKHITQVEKTGRHIRNYIKAWEVHQLIEQSGNRFPHLTPTHLAKIGESRCNSDDERLEIAKRVNDQQASVSSIKAIACGVHREINTKLRRLNRNDRSCRVINMDGASLLEQQKEGSIECLIVDCQWAPVPGLENGVAPESQPDWLEHVSRCLTLATSRLADNGLVCLHWTASRPLDCRLHNVIDCSGLKHAGEYIWRKPCGAFQNADSPLMVAHEPICLLCKSNSTPQSCCGGVSSVSQKLAPHTRANSGQMAEHPCQKPVELYEQLIAVATVNGLVVDVYAGSGSAGVAAARRGCPYIGAEVVPEYVEIANRRIAEAKYKLTEVSEAVQFFLDGATEDQVAIIKAALGKADLALEDDMPNA